MIKFKKIYVFYGILGTIVAFISCSDQVDKPYTPPASYSPPKSNPPPFAPSSSESRKLSYPEIFCGLNGCASSIIYLLDGNKPYIAYKNDHFNNESITGHKENMTNFSKFSIMSNLFSTRKYDLKLLTDNSFCRELKINNNGNNFEILDPIPKLKTATVCSFQVIFKSKVAIKNLELFFNYTFNDWKGAAGDGTEAQRVARLIDSRTKKLELKNQNIYDLSSIVTLVDLEELNLENNKISEITPYIRELKKLTAINFNHNNINELPKEMGELKKLKTIYFNNNQLTEFPSFIVNLFNPYIIDLSHNKIKQIPNNFNSGSYVQLEELNLDNNNIKELSGNIFVTSLKRLSLKQNKMKTIKDFDLSLQNLTNSIDLSHNELSQKLPSVFFNSRKFVNLTKLDLSHNKFIDFPLLTEKEYLYLKELILNDNNIQGEIDLSNFDGLINVNLNNNQLSLLPKFNLDIKNSVVSLKNNKFTNFTNYQVVKPYSNAGSIDLSNNQITSMRYFPGFAWQKLNLESNLLEELSYNTFANHLFDNSSNGVVVNLKNNRIVKIDCNFFNNKMSTNPNILLEENPGFSKFGMNLIQITSGFRRCENK